MNQPTPLKRDRLLVVENRISSKSQFTQSGTYEGRSNRFSVAVILLLFLLMGCGAACTIFVNSVVALAIWVATIFAASRLFQSSVLIVSAILAEIELRKSLNGDSELISWSEAAQRLNDGHGILVVNKRCFLHSSSHAGFLWWCADNSMESKNDVVLIRAPALAWVLGTVNWGVPLERVFELKAFRPCHSESLPD